MQSTANAAGPICVDSSETAVDWASTICRRAISLHMWLGAATTLYIIVLCLSGCAMLFERDLYRLLSPDPAVEAETGPRLASEELMSIALSRYPEDRIVGLWDKRISRDVIAEVWLDSREGLRQRLLDPYTGADLGTAQPLGLRILAVVRQSHMSPAAGTPGRLINGIGSTALLLLASSALLSRILGRRTRSHPAADAVRSLHRRAGIWLVPLAMVWGATGMILSGPALFGERTLDWAYALHTGSGGGWITKAVWAAFALLTPAVALVGVWTWWRKAATTHIGSCWSAQVAGPPSSSSAEERDFPPGSTITRAAATNGSDLARYP